jgi:iron complex outermembrane receptor protein
LQNSGSFPNISQCLVYCFSTNAFTFFKDSFNFAIEINCATLRNFCKSITYTILLWACTISVIAQKATLKGIVTDKSNNQTLIGVNIFTQNGKGVSTDTKGGYELKLDPGKYTITASFISYNMFKAEVELKAGETQTFNIAMESSNKQLNLVVVSGSRYEKNVALETMSVDVLSPTLIKNTNAVDLSDVVQKSPGVNVIDGQASIRAGSGFSYGVGSRVMMLVDDLPLLSGDMGNANWRFMPIELAENVEVAKTASSVLYGSSALNGVVHLRTGWAKSRPETSISFYSGITGTPRNRYQKWWDDYSQPFFTGGFFSHRQKFGQLDVVVGGNYHMEKSFLQNNDQQRFRMNFKTRYRPKKNPYLTYGLNGNFMWERSGRFFLWQDADTNSLRIYDGSNDQYYFFSLDPHMDFNDDKGNRHSLKTRFYRTFRFGDGIPNSVSNLIYLDYQYRKEFNQMFALTVGTTGSYGFMSSNLYPGKRQTFFGAAFSQLDFKYKRWNAVFGARVEYNRVDTTQFKVVPVFRAGLNYHAGKATYLRANFGQGYRVPTIVERFLDASFAGGLQIIPNSKLLPEQGYNFEIGVKQALKISNWLGFFDACVFWMESRNMVEYQFVYQGSTLGFKPNNVSRARVGGFELSVMGEGKLGNLPFRTIFGYTYAYPADLQADSTQRNLGVYFSRFFKDFPTKLTVGEASNILKYRNRHTFRADFELDIRKFSVGTTLYYNSFFENFDAVLGLFDLDRYIKKRLNRPGDFFMDARVAYNINDAARISFLVKNLTNLEYANRPGMMNSPISYTIQFRYNIK